MQISRRNSGLVCIFLLINVLAFNQVKNKDKLISEKKKIENEIKLTNKLLEDTRKKKKSTINNLQLLNRQIEQRNRLINQLNEEINLIEKEIEKNQNTLQSLKNDLEKVKAEYANLIYHAYKNRTDELNLMYLLASDDINQFYIRYKYLQQYKEYRKKQIALIKRLNIIIEHKIIELSESKNEKKRIINEELTQKANLLEDTQETDRIVKLLKKQEEDLKKELKKKEKIAAKLENEIEELIKKESKKNTYEALTPQEKIISTDFAKNYGRLPWPTEKGIITDKYGEHPHPVIKDLMVRNNGIDISTVPGSSARAIFEGEVSKIFNIKGANSTVIIRHGNYYTVYHNLTKILVKVGDRVTTKQRIGEVFTDTNKDVTILHFEVWKEIEKQNPEMWLSN